MALCGRRSLLILPMANVAGLNDAAIEVMLIGSLSHIIDANHILIP